MRRAAVIDLPSSIGKAAELRDAFDRARAIPFASQAGERMESLLAIRVCGDPYAVRISEISGLANDRKIVALPSAMPELIGLAGIRGALIPVYSLASLLGYSAEVVPGRWLALSGTGEPVGLVFSQFEGYAMVPYSQVYAAERKDETRTHVTHVVHTADVVRAVISIPLIHEVIQRRCGKQSKSKER
jgi:chemotaxis signal transduction protein